MINMKDIFFILLLLFTTELSYAEVYKWVDEKGGVHFTDDFLQIPEKYRPVIEKIGLPREEVGKKTEGDILPKKKEDNYRDQLGRGEEYWKGRVEEWRKKLRTLQERNESLRIKYNELTEKYNDSKSSVERAILRNERDQIKNEMEQTRLQVGEAEKMLDKKIPEEADLYKAKQEWIRQ
ncbi:MAG: DUF4124 domain-containing protein [Thermodesulfobacteriota bacterium]